MTYLTKVHSSVVVKCSQYSLYFGFLSHSWVNSHNWYARSINSNVEFDAVFTFIIDSTGIRTLSSWQWMNSFRPPGVWVINTASILCFMNLSFRSFTTSWIIYFPNDVCQTRPHSRHLVDSRIALFSQSLTVPNVCAFILSKLLIALMGFPRLRTAFHPETTHEYTQSKLNNLHHAWYVVVQCTPQDTGDIKGRLQFPSHRVFRRSITHRISL